MSNYTPGPWKLETAPGGPNEGWCISAKTTLDGSEHHVILAQRNAIQGEEFAANARLIVAAPELAEMVSILAHHLNAMIDDPEDFRVPDLERAFTLLRQINGKEDPE
ncbi:MAG: hypothetical protein IJR68_06515 [Fretibacterium sp.]|nr:hypothetical protein [Fretibacterium sp.]